MSKRRRAPKSRLRKITSFDGRLETLECGHSIRPPLDEWGRPRRAQRRRCPYCRPERHPRYPVPRKESNAEILTRSLEAFGRLKMRIVFQVWAADRQFKGIQGTSLIAELSSAESVNDVIGEIQQLLASWDEPEEPLQRSPASPPVLRSA